MEKRSSNPLIPAAMIIAGIAVGGALLLSTLNPERPINVDPEQPFDFSALAPISESDHILGSPNARIIIIEYGDLDCPACKAVHPTFKRLIAEYGKDGTLAWVYRHFPIEQLHTGTTYKAAVSECVANNAGEKAFWNFIDSVYTRSGETQEDLIDIAVEVGADRTKVQSCAITGQYLAKVEAGFTEARTIGSSGTPFIIIDYPEGVPSAAITQIEQVGIELGEPGNIQVLDMNTKIVIQAPFSYEVFATLVKALLF